MESFDSAKKVTLIKEIKNLVEGMNLVQVSIKSLRFGKKVFWANCYRM
jgi:hypothetical protein